MVTSSHFRRTVALNIQLMEYKSYRSTFGLSLKPHGSLSRPDATRDSPRSIHSIVHSVRESLKRRFSVRLRAVYLTNAVEAPRIRDLVDSEIFALNVAGLSASCKFRAKIVMRRTVTHDHGKKEFAAAAAN